MSGVPPSSGAPTLRSPQLPRWARSGSAVVPGSELPATGAPELVFKRASELSEFEQIHRLNHETFAEEIPQHPVQPGRRLVDRFHADNIYFICLQGQTLVGMLAVRGERPFSLDHKLPELDTFLPPGSRPCEVRLLAIPRQRRGARGGRVLAGLLALLWQHAKQQGFDVGLISGTTRQLALYRHLGFVPFGPLMGATGAQFQPMYVSMVTFEAASRSWSRAAPVGPPRSAPVSFLPGPVASSPEVRRAFELPPESHRTEAFASAFRATQQLVCELVRAPSVQFFLGSGTLANDVVAGQLAQLGGRGLVLSNGEFGERLIDHARRFQLDFEALRFPWGGALELAPVVSGWRRAPPAWLWCVHCETSTGVLNDLPALQQECSARGVKLCVDCISSLGAVPVDLRGAHLATGSSGKALRAYPGLCMVFHRDTPERSERLPRYLDLGSYAREGTPFTFSSNLLYALQAALRGVDWQGRFAQLNERSAWLRSQLGAAGFELVGGASATSPAVITLALPPDQRSDSVAAALGRAGYLLSYNSRYLRERNWLQICLMGETAPGSLVELVGLLRQAAAR